MRAIASTHPDTDERWHTISGFGISSTPPCSAEHCVLRNPKVRLAFRHPPAGISAIAKKPKSAPRKLKVFRTAIGFHDAYVAAPTKKAALAAWGSKKDLFGRGAAEEVTDVALSEEALTSPGVVIKRLRGTVAEQLAALPPDTVHSRRPNPAELSSTASSGGKRKVVGKSRPAPKPKPSRAALDAAEGAVVELSDRQEAELSELTEREAELAREKRALLTRHTSEIDRRNAAERTERRAYEAAIKKWRG